VPPVLARRDFNQFADRKNRGRQPWVRLLLILVVLAACVGASLYAAKSGGKGGGASVPPQRASSAASAPAGSAAPSTAPQKERQQAAVPLQKAARPLSVQVQLSRQRVRVLDAKGRLVREFVCSSGKTGSETPVGTFTVSDRGKSFFNAKVDEGAYYWTRFYGTYLFHSVPFDKHYRMEEEEADKLGEPASHGCIRLPVEDAKWIYDNIPEGTKVVIE